jgi:hypothetical protein
MLYAGGEMARDMVRIFTAEMARPSKVLNKIVEKHTKPEVLAIMASVRIPLVLAGIFLVPPRPGPRHRAIGAEFLPGRRGA